MQVKGMHHVPVEIPCAESTAMVAGCSANGNTCVEKLICPVPGPEGDIPMAKRDVPTRKAFRQGELLFVPLSKEDQTDVPRINSTSLTLGRVA
jgi:hypothetical protein